MIEDLIIFHVPDDDLGHTTVYEHTITIGYAFPINDMLRPLTHHRRHFAENELRRYIRLDIVGKADPGKVPWSSAIVLLNKKENDLSKILDAIPIWQDYREHEFIT